MKQEIIKSQAKPATKAKRRLKDITFDHEGAHLALCSKEQGAANLTETALIFKSQSFSRELIEKAQRVQVEMELPEFLSKFFGLWSEDAAVLARLMGYVPEPDEEDSDEYDWKARYEKEIQERVDSFTILKSLHEAESLSSEMQKLTEEQLHKVFDDQEKIIKAIKEFDAQKSSGTDTSNSGEVMKEVSTSKINKGKKKMTVEKEMVERSQLESVEKSLASYKEELLKAQELVTKYQEAEKQAIVKSKTDAVQAVLQDEKTVAVVMKAALALEAQEDFDALVAVLKGLKDEAAAEKQKVEKSDLFKEIGATVDAEEKPQESKLTQLIKSKYPTK